MRLRVDLARAALLTMASALFACGSVAADHSAAEASPCPAVVPAEGASCSAPGLVCGNRGVAAGYGSFSCPESAACTDAGWAVYCPRYPFGTETGTCGCAHPE